MGKVMSEHWASVFYERRGPHGKSGPFQPSGKLLSILAVFAVIASAFFVTLTLLPTRASAATWYVGGSGPGNYSAIQAAVDVADPGDTVFVYNGTYHEQVNITKPLTLIGENRTNTTIDGDAAWNVVTVSADWVNITGFRIVNGSTTWYMAGLMLDHVRNCTITSNNVSSNPQSGIYLNYSDNNKIVDNAVTENSAIFEGNIYLLHSNNNTIAGNNASKGSRGVHLALSNNNTVANNTAWLNWDYGVFVDSSQKNAVYNNTLLDNWGRGVYLYGSGNSTILNNTFKYNLQGIRLMYSFENLVGNNSVLDNWDDGIELRYSNSNRVINNTVTSEFEAVYLSYSDNNFVAGNFLRSFNYSDALLDFSVADMFTNNVFQENGIFITPYGEPQLKHWNTHSIDITNMVHGRPVYYWTNATGGSIPAGAGQVILANCTGVIVEDQNLSHVYTGVESGYSPGNTIRNVTASNDSYGVFLLHSDGTVLNMTRFLDDKNGIYLLSSNDTTVDSFVASGSSSVALYPNAALFLDDSNRNTITNGSVMNNPNLGIFLLNSHNNVIERSTVSANMGIAGIRLQTSWNNTISNNMISSNSQAGIYLDSARNTTVADSRILSNVVHGVHIASIEAKIVRNEITGNGNGTYAQNSRTAEILNNTFSGNVNGILFDATDGSTVVGNSISTNTNGALVLSGSGNSFHHNNFISNTNQASSAGVNFWDNGYPSGGNYWSDYTGVDFFNGPNQDQPGGDAIGDTPYAIPGGANEDKYPLTYPVTAPPFRPSRPGNLTATPGDGQAVLTWEDPLSNGGVPITNHRIYRGTAAGSEVFLTEVGNVTTHTDLGLTNGKSYYYRVTAKNAVGEGPVSNEASTIPVTVPGQPTGLTATPADRQVSLAWTAPSINGGSPITNYRIYRGTTSGGETPLTTIGNLTSYLDGGLTNGVTYYYQVAAINGAGEGLRSTEASAIPKSIPTEPQNLVATAGNGQVTLNWTAPASDGGSPITNYRIYRGATSGSEVFLIEIGNVLTYSDPGLANGQAYYYQVSARNSVGEGPRSAEVSAIPKAVPTEPQNLVATAGNGRVVLNWTAPASDGGSPITNYRIYRGPTSGSEVFIIELGNVLTYTDPGLANGQVYYYQVSAKNLAGEGPRSAETSATPATLPSEPLLLAASPGVRQITLNWFPPSSNGGLLVIGYKVYRGTTPGGESYLVTVGATGYTDSGIANGQTYYYTVSALNLVGEGPQSNEANARTSDIPSAPENLQATAGVSQVTLVWDLPSSTGGSPITGYRLYRGFAPGTETLLLDVGNVLTYTDSGVTNGFTYFYKVSAVTLVGEGPLSNEASATPVTVPSMPPSLQAVARSGKITLSWAAPYSDGGSRITNYTVYRGASSGSETPLVEVGSVLTCDDLTVLSGQTYYYKVAARNSVGEGPTSPEASAMISAPSTIPTAPLSLQATAGNGRVTISWTKPASDGGSPITAYRVYQGITAGSEVFIAALGNVLTYTDPGLTNGQTYYYQVTAINRVGESQRSNEASAKPLGLPSQPLGLAATATTTEIDLSWSAPSTDGGSPIMAYAIYRSVLPGGEVLLTTVSGSQLAYADSGVTLATRYYYLVKARSAVGEGPSSNEVSALAGAPSGNFPPTCAVNSPASDATLSGIVSVSGVASDPDGAVTRVQVQIDDGPWFVAVGTTSWTYQWNTSTSGNGQHTIHVRSFDGTDYSTTVTLTVTVSNAPSKGQDNTLGFAALGIILAILLVWLFLRFRRRRTSSSTKAPDKAESKPKK